MKSITKHTEKEKFWRQQMAAADKYPGSQKEFCEFHGLSIHTFQYWGKKFRQAKCRQQLDKPVPFVSVEVLKPEFPLQHLPEAKWLAELIFHLQAGVR